jgi:hypothetical protein
VAADAPNSLDMARFQLLVVEEVPSPQDPRGHGRLTAHPAAGVHKASDGATRRRIPRLQPSLALKAMPPEPGRPQEAGRALRSGPA